MKILINTFLGLALLLTVVSCSEDSVLTETLDASTSGAALRSLVETNSLDISDLSSTYSHLFEIQDEEFGDLVSEVRVYVGFSDDAATNDDPANNVAPALFQTLARSIFTVQNTQTTHDLPEGTFTTTLGDVLTFMSLDPANDVNRGDIVNFNFEILTTDGRIFNATNVGPNTGATGRFAFFNSPFNYTAAIDDPNRVVLSSVEVDDSNASIRAGVADSVFLSFDTELITLPTIAANDFQGNAVADEGVGAVTQLEGGEYFFFYTAGAAAADTVSFTFTGAESVDGFEMATVTEEDAYIIDNTPPSAIVNESTLTVGTGNTVGSISVDLLFPEEVSDTVTYVITSAQFDTVTIRQNAGEEAEEATISFSPSNGGAAVPAGAINFNIAISGENGKNGIDAAGNAIVASLPVAL